MTESLHKHIICCVVLFLSFNIYAAEPEQASSSQQETNNNLVTSRTRTLNAEAAAVAEDKSELAIWKSEFNSRKAKLESNHLKTSDLEKARLEVQALKVSLKSISLDIVAAEQHRLEIEKSIQQLNDQLQSLAADPVTATAENISTTKSALAKEQSLLKLEVKHIEQLNQRNALTRERLSLAEKWWTAVRNTYQRQQEKIQQQTLGHLENQLSSERDKWQQEIIKLNIQLAQFRERSDISQAQRDQTEVQLLKAEASIFLDDIRYRLTQSQIQMELIAAQSSALAKEPRSMKLLYDKLIQLKVSLIPLNGLLKNKANLIQQRLEVMQKRKNLDVKNATIYDEINLILEDQLKAINTLSSEISSHSQKLNGEIVFREIAYRQQKKQDLTQRHHLPRSFDEWQSVWSEIKNLPATLLQTGRLILVSLHTAMQQADFNVWSLLFMLGFAWSIVCLSLWRLKPAERFVATKNFTEKILFISSSWLRANRFGLLLGGLLMIAAWVLDIIPPGLLLISILVAIWLGAWLLIELSWWILKSPLGLSEQQPGLYRLIVLWVIVISFFCIILALAHLGLFSNELQDLADRTFMLLLLPMVYLSFRMRKLLMHSFRTIKGNIYWIKLLGLAVSVIPIAILTAAVLGIFGYIDLAWSVAGYLSLFILVAAGWLIARGLVIDLSKNLGDMLASKSERGAFWVRSLVVPVQLMIRIGLLLLAAWVFYRLLGGDPAIGLQIKNWLTYPVFSIGKFDINSLNLLGTLCLLFLVFYIGRWARDITYGWLYSNIQDIGIRNSLSVFTQYAVVVVGILIALNILGIDLTSLTIFAGALGVGIGFGLQNIANNFISGLILLAERPIRTDDWVTIGNNEGTVSEIGMRSVTVTTWDNQDVIIPNSDLVSNAFVNWTRTNKIVRTVLTIGVRYQDDPHIAKKIIKEAVIMQPEVLLDPEPHVWLTEFAASSVNFRVQYYIDVGEFSRLKIKSDVMFAIWDALKEANIGIPFPQQDIYIKELPDIQPKLN